MSTTARAAAPARPRAGRPERPPLAVVAPPRPRHGRSAFVAVVAGLLAAGLAALLVMNTWLAQDAFVVHNLQAERAELAVNEQALARELAAQEDPASLAARARALGMQSGGSPLFLELPSGRVLGARDATGAR